MTETAETVTYTYTISAEQLAATRAKFAKINGRATRGGLQGSIELTSVREVTVKLENVAGLAVETVMFEVTIGGETPRFNGWEFIATLDWDQHAGLIVRAAPGAPTVDRSALREGWCDHCKTTRDRSKTFVVRSADGVQVQVGSTCIKDFTGWSGSISWLEGPSEGRESDWFGPVGRVDYSVETVLAYAWAIIKLHGWAPASFGFESTKCLVDRALYPNPKRKDDLEFARTLAPLAEEAKGRAAEIKDFILSSDFWGGGDYTTNLKAVCAGSLVSPRNFGLVVSAPQAHARFQEKTLLKEKAAKVGADSEWFGTPAVKGAKSVRHELDVTVVGIRYIEGDYGTTTLYTMVGPDGNLFKWFASNGTLGEKEGASFKIKATVKAHDEFKGVKSTTLTRCTVVQAL